MLRRKNSLSNAFSESNLVLPGNGRMMTPPKSYPGSRGPTSPSRDHSVPRPCDLPMRQDSSETPKIATPVSPKWGETPDTVRIYVPYSPQTTPNGDLNLSNGDIQRLSSSISPSPKSSPTSPSDPNRITIRLGSPVSGSPILW